MHIFEPFNVVFASVSSGEIMLLSYLSHFDKRVLLTSTKTAFIGKHPQGTKFLQQQQHQQDFSIMLVAQ